VNKSVAKVEIVATEWAEAVLMRQDVVKRRLMLGCFSLPVHVLLFSKTLSLLQLG